jgi:hypothetical protein
MAILNKMASRPFTILNEQIRQNAIDFLRSVPFKTRVLFSQQKRTTLQSDKMWAMLFEVSEQTDWHGVMLEPEDWKILFMASLNQEMRIVPNLANNGFVNLGRSTSKLSVAEMSGLIEVIYSFAASRGIKFKNEV